MLLRLVAQALSVCYAPHASPLGGTFIELLDAEDGGGIGVAVDGDVLAGGEA